MYAWDDLGLVSFRVDESPSSSSARGRLVRRIDLGSLELEVVKARWLLLFDDSLMVDELPGQGREILLFRLLTGPGTVGQGLSLERRVSCGGAALQLLLLGLNELLLHIGDALLVLVPVMEQCGAALAPLAVRRSLHCLKLKGARLLLLLLLSVPLPIE